MIFIIITNVNQIIFLSSLNSSAVSHYTYKKIETLTLGHLALSNLDLTSLSKLIFYDASLCPSTTGIPASLILKYLHLLFPLTRRSRSSVFNSFRSFLICHLPRKADVTENLYKITVSTSAPAWTHPQSPSFPSLNLPHNPHSVFVVSCTVIYFISLLLKGKLPKRRTDHNLFITLICPQCLMQYLCSNFLPLCLLLLSLWHKYTFSQWYLSEICLSINETLKCHLSRTLKHVISSENMATNIPLFSLETVTAVFLLFV